MQLPSFDLPVEPLDRRMVSGCPFVTEISQICFDLRLAQIGRDDDIGRGPPLAIWPLVERGPAIARASHQHTLAEDIKPHRCYLFFQQSVLPANRASSRGESVPRKPCQRPFFSFHAAKSARVRSSVAGYSPRIERLVHGMVVLLWGFSLGSGQKMSGSSTAAPNSVSRKSKSHPSFACLM